MKLHVNRTCFHASLKSQTGLSSFRLLCEHTLNHDFFCKYVEVNCSASTYGIVINILFIFTQKIENVLMKLRKTSNCLKRNFFSTYKNMYSSTSISQTSENVFLFVFISSFVTLEYVFRISNRKLLLELIKRISKVH